jgi:hypothetical protein
VWAAVGKFEVASRPGDHQRTHGKDRQQGAIESKKWPPAKNGRQ